MTEAKRAPNRFPPGTGRPRAIYLPRALYDRIARLPPHLRLQFNLSRVCQDAITKYLDDLEHGDHTERLDRGPWH